MNAGNERLTLHTGRKFRADAAGPMLSGPLYQEEGDNTGSPGVSQECLPIGRSGIGALLPAVHGRLSPPICAYKTEGFGGSTTIPTAERTERITSVGVAVIWDVFRACRRN